MQKISWKNMILRIGRLLAVPRSPQNIRKVVYIMFGGTLLIATYILSLPYLAGEFEYNEGDIAKEDVYVFRDIYYEKEDELKKQRQEAYERQRFIFDRNYQVFRDIVEKLDTEFSLFSRISPDSDGVKLAQSRLPFLAQTKSITNNDVQKFLSDKNIKKIPEWAARYITLIFDRYGILDKPLPNLKKFDRVGAEVRTINRSSDSYENLIWGAEYFIYAKDIFDYKNYARLKNLHEREELSFQANLSDSTKKIAIHRILQHLHNNPYTRYNPSLTEKLKTQAQNNINPGQHLLKKGLIIVREGDPIDHDTYEKIKILNRVYRRTNITHILGIFLIQVSIAFAMAFYISRFSEFKLRELASNTILFSLILSFMLYSFGLSRISFLHNSGWYLALFVPCGFFGIVGTILLGTRITFSLNIYLSFFIYFISGYQMESFLINFVTGIAGIHTATYMQKRTQIIQGALTIALTFCIIIIGLEYTTQVRDTDLVNKLLIGSINSVACVSLASSFLPFYESIFNLPTKFRLLELADNSNELLMKVATEAPSTYTHTLMVATLSERAVNAIDGDGLLTRVGCLYHDIGKTLKPTFYAENRHLDENSARFQELGPYQSAQVIIGHVTDGVILAREHHLPEKVIDFIPEHHGTTTIQYFYHQALSQASRSKKKQVSKQEFQYPGPKPQSKETAVVMIADSVEAAARSIDNPNQENLEKMIEKIIQNKIMEDQFDECSLTLNDIKVIKSTFIDVLLNSFHLRPKYPDMKSTKDLENVLHGREREAGGEPPVPSHSGKKAAKSS